MLRSLAKRRGIKYGALTILIILISGAYEYLALAGPPPNPVGSQVGNVLTEQDIYFTGSLYQGLDSTNVTDVLKYPELGASCTIWVDAGVYYAKNGHTGVVTSNANAATLINTCIAALTPGRTHPEKISLKGSITISAPIALTGYTVLDLTASKLTLAAASNCNMITLTGFYNWVVGGILDGGKAGQASGDGIRANAGAQRFWLTDIKIKDCKDYGVNLQGTGASPNDVGVGVIHGLEIEDCGNHGLFSGPWSADHVFSECNFGGNSGSGICLSASASNIITGCFAWNNAGKGFDLWDSNDNVITGGRVDFNGDWGVVLGGTSTRNIVSNVRVYSNVAGQMQAATTGNRFEGNLGADNVDSVQAWILGNATDTLSTVGGWIAGNTTAATAVSPYSYIVYKSGATYYANSTTGDTNYDNADFDAMMNTLIAAASAGDHIHLKAGTYVVSATITGKSGVSLSGEGEGTILDASTMAGSDIALDWSGSIAAGVALNADEAVGSSNVNVAGGGEAGFSAGDMVLIYSSAVWKGNNENQCQGEIQHVASTNVGQINFDSVLVDAYAVADTAKIAEITVNKDFTLSDFKIIGGGAGDAHNGISLSYVYNAKVKDVTIVATEHTGVSIQWSMMVDVSGCYFEDINEAGFGYGVVLAYAVQNIHVDGNTGRDCRHTISCGGGASVPGGIPRDVTYSNNQSYDATAAHYDCHNVGEGINIVDNQAIGGYSGIWPGMSTGVVSGNTVIGCTYRGLFVNNDAAYGVIISGNTFRQCGDDAINFENGAAGYQIIHNTIVNCQQEAMVLINFSNGTIGFNYIIGNGQAADDTYNQVELHDDSNNNLIVGNFFYDGGGAVQPYGGLKIDDAACDGNRVYQNYLANGGKSDNYTDNGTGTVVDNNIT